MNLSLHNISKRYGSQPALRDVSLEIPTGCITAVMGRNGAGKSTLLRAISTLSPPDHGRILLGGQPLVRSDVPLRRQLMFLPDTPVIFQSDSVLKNLSILLRLYECDTEPNVTRITKLLTEFDMLACAEKPVSELSRGQIYKTALIALIAVNPQLWLLDEPFASGMDPDGLAALKRHLRAAAASGRTVVFTTQILEIAEPLAGFACILDEGRLAAAGPMADLVAQSGSLESLFSRLRENPSP